MVYQQINSSLICERTTRSRSKFSVSAGRTLGVERPRPFEDLPDDSIIQSWLISFKEISSRPGSEAIKILGFLSQFQRHVMPVSLVKEAFGESWSIERDLTTLCEFELIARRANKDVIDIHRFTQLTARAWLEDTDEAEKISNLALLTISKMLEESYQKDRVTCRLLLPHAEEIRLRMSSPIDKVQFSLLNFHLAKCLFDLGSFARAVEPSKVAYEGLEQAREFEQLEALGVYVGSLCEIGHYDDAESVLRKEIQEVDGYLKEISDETTRAWIDSFFKALQCRVLFNRGKWEEAEKVCREAVAIRETTFGPDNGNTLASQLSLALILRHQGRQNEALLIYDKMKPKVNEAFRHYEQLVYQFYNNYGECLIKLAKYDQAEEMLQKALAGWKTTMPDHPSTYIAVQNLAICLLECEKISLQQALVDTKTQLDNAIKVFGRNFTVTLSIRNSYGVLLRSNGLVLDALREMDNVIEQRTLLNGANHPDTISAVQESIPILRALNDRQQAKERSHRVFKHLKGNQSIDDADIVVVGCWYAQELMVREATVAVDLVSEVEDRYQAFSVNGNFNFRALDMLVSLYRQFRQFDKAIALLNDTMNRDDLQPIQRVFTQGILPMVFEDIGDYGAADVEYQKLLELCQQTGYAESTPPEFYKYTYHRAHLKLTAGKNEEAERMMREVINLQTTKFGPKDRNTLISIARMAQILNARGKYEAAELLNREVLAQRRWSLPNYDDGISASLNNLAMTLSSRKNYANALVLMNDCYSSHCRVRGHLSNAALRSKHNLAVIYTAAGELDKALITCQEVLDARESVLCLLNQSTVDTLRLKLEILHKQEVWKVVVQLRDELLQRQEASSDPDTKVEVLNVLSMTGEAFLHLNSLDKASEDCRRAFDDIPTLRGGIKRNSPRHTDWNRAFSTLESIYQRQERATDLASLVQRKSDVESRMGDSMGTD